MIKRLGISSLIPQPEAPDKQGPADVMLFLAVFDFFPDSLLIFDFVFTDLF